MPTQPHGLVPLLLALAAVVHALPAQAAEQPVPAKADPTATSGGSDRVALAKTMLEKTIENRRLAAVEKSQWKLGRQLMSDEIEMLGREIASLQRGIDETEKNLSETDSKKAELVAENDKLKAAATRLEAAIGELETRTKALLPMLPEPIRDRVRELSQQIPDDPTAATVSLGSRFFNVIGVLNEINKFNREVTVTSEVHTLPDGTSAVVTALYLGIGQGYYVTAKGEAAAIGTATADGWVWTPANAAAPRIAKAIAIYNNKEAAAFVRLPVRIK